MPQNNSKPTFQFPERSRYRFPVSHNFCEIGFIKVASFAEDCETADTTHINFELLFLGQLQRRKGEFGTISTIL